MSKNRLFPVFNDDQVNEESQKNHSFPTFSFSASLKNDTPTSDVKPLNREMKATDFFNKQNEEKYVYKNNDIEPVNKEVEADVGDYYETKKKKKDKKRKRDKKSKKPKKNKDREDKIKKLMLDMEHIKEDPRKYSIESIFSNEENIFDPTKKEYFRDVRGDKDNIIFGIPLRGVPLFQRLKHTCLGLERGYYVKWLPDKTFDLISYRDKEKALNKKTPRYTSSKNKNIHLEDYQLKRISKKQSVPNVNRDESFIPVDVNIEFEKPEVQEDIEIYLTNKNRELSEMTFKRPNDISAWLKFIEFQDEYARLSRNPSSSIRPILETKIDIFKKAIAKNPASDTLILGYMACCERIYEAEKMHQLWNEAISYHYESGVLWKAYMNFVKSHFSSFTMSSFRKVYTSALKSLNKVKKMYKVDSDKFYQIESAALNIAISAIYIERQAGYIERAISMFQSLIEIRFFCPDNLEDINIPRETFLAFFQAFWDSESPRFGENGSIGWKNWQKSIEEKVKHVEDIVQTYDPDKPTTYNSEDEWKESFDEEDLNEEKDLINETMEVDFNIEQWLNKEEYTESNPRLPLKTEQFEKESIDDPDRAVLFDDIKEFIFKIFSESVSIKLLEQFLLFLVSSYPLKGTTNNSDNIVFIEETIESIGNIFEILESMNYPNQNSIDTENIITEEKIKWKFVQWDRLDVNISRSEEYNIFIKNVIKLCFNSIEEVKRDTSFYNLLIRVNLRFNPSFDLNTYPITNIDSIKVLCDFANTKKDDQERINVYDSILSKISSESIYDFSYIVRLYSINEINNNREKNRILSILLSLTEGKYIASDVNTPSNVSSVRIMRSRKKFGEILQKVLEGNNPDYILNITTCYAIFEFITLNPQKAFDVYNLSLEKLKTLSPYNHEILTVDRVNLVLLEMYKDNSIRKITPSTLKSIIQESANEYTNNPIILSSLLLIQEKSKITGDLRRYFDKILISKKEPKERLSSIPWLFAIRSETKLGSANRIRNLFERALKSSEMTRQSMVLWKYYLDFELSNGNISSAKGIFYRAISNTPWCKSVWLYSVKRLMNHLSESEIGDILKMMEEKELRFQSPFNE